MEAHPRVEVVFRSTVSTDRTVADILAGIADVGFASKPVHSATLQVTELFEDELLLVVSPAHRLARVGIATVRTSACERLILFERVNRSGARAISSSRGPASSPISRSNRTTPISSS